MARKISNPHVTAVPTAMQSAMSQAGIAVGQVTSITPSGASMAANLAAVGVALVAWEKEHSLNTNAERKARATEFLEFVIETAPLLSVAEQQASADCYASDLAKLKDANTTAVMKSNYLLLLRNSSMIDSKVSIKKNLASIRARLNPQSEEDRLQDAVTQAGKEYLAALEALEAAHDALEQFRNVSRIKELAKSANANMIPGKQVVESAAA